MSSEQTPYVESPIIMTVVRLIGPFILTYGLFITLHGTDSPGGGFQGGVVVASVFILLSFAFGVGPMRDWIDNTALTSLLCLGLLIFGSVAVFTIPLGGALLELHFYPFDVKWGVELVEIAISMLVAAVITGLFLVIAWGHLMEMRDVEEEEGGEGS